MRTFHVVAALCASVLLAAVQQANSEPSALGRGLYNSRPQGKHQQHLQNQENNKLKSGRPNYSLSSFTEKNGWQTKQVPAEGDSAQSSEVRSRWQSVMRLLSGYQRPQQEGHQVRGSLNGAQSANVTAKNFRAYMQKA